MNSSKTFKPELNTPYELAFRYPSGKPVNGFSGPQLQWILTDGRFFYTPLDFADKLKAVGIKPGQKFIAEKRTDGRKAEWFVSNVPNVPVVRGQSSSAQKAVAIIEQAGALDAPEAEDAGNAQPMPNRPATALEVALKTAVSAAAEAERHGLQIGYNVRFSSADIRALGISAFIGMRERAA